MTLHKVAVAMMATLATAADNDLRNNLRSSASSMTCGANVQVCGVLTLESGLGGGVYNHSKPGVHGLWPETGMRSSIC
jgi:hypothetical protein